MYRIGALLCIFNTLWILSYAQGFDFPDDNTLYRNSECNHSSGRKGRCVAFNDCPNQMLGSIRENICSYEGRIPIVCCVNMVLRGDGLGSSGVDSPPINFTCGIPSIRSFRENPRFRRQLPDTENFPGPEDRFQINVVGGIRSINDAWPWAAVIGVRENITSTRWVCTGTLINSKYVISAAHCIIQAPGINVIRLGENELNNEFDGAIPIDFNIIRSISHPEYVFVPVYHDVILYELDRPAIFSDSISPACLPWSNFGRRNLVNSQVTIAGWGATSFGGPISDQLMEANITVFEPSFCDTAYRGIPTYSRDFTEGITDEFYLCAGNATHSVDTCGGDSGGPVVFFANGVFTLVAVTSRGYGCGSTAHPGLYVNLLNPQYIQWIKDVAF